ncbi:MAG: M14 family zinc carboxypeptidase [Bacteroidota bacterium]
MKRILLLLSFCFSTFILSQNLKSPSEFLGYELGTQFTRQYEVVDYYEHVAEMQPDKVKLMEYGRTNERRPLLVAYVSSVENMANLESIREEHLKALNGEGNQDKAIVWLSYNVHGNESVGTEASMSTIYELLTNKSDYLKNTVVIIDPCLNPDGRDRYINWYNQYKNETFQVDPNSKEHHEGWISGRSNHYMFDLNRDWAWLTQVESRMRLKQYNKWMPHVHVDFHEQGVNDPYYFAPAAEPYHEVITDFQRSFQEIIGRNHAKYFDANGWFYFTKERFDLFYPSYGDTYPTYNGSIGMTYEQGGSGRAGLGIITDNGDTLTLKDRIAHHFTTGLSTIEVASNNVEKLNTEFKKFFQRKNFKYKSYVLSGNEDHLRALEKLLSQHEIEYARAKKNTIKGIRYSSGGNASKNVDENSLVVSTNQPKGTLVKVLFEPNAKLSDSLTYDITAWSLPYAYGLEGLATNQIVAGIKGKNNTITAEVSPNAYAYLTDWNSMDDARFLADLLKKGGKVRTAYAPFSLKGKSYKRGTLIITKSDNETLEDFGTILKEVAKTHHKTLDVANTGFVDSGKDFGSGYVQMIEKPKVAVLTGGPSSSYRFGEIWHYFEKQLHYPITAIDTDYIDRIDLEAYNILVLPGGRYTRFMNDNRLNELKAWVRNGGKLIAMGGAIDGIDGESGFGIKRKKSIKDTIDMEPMAHEDRQREAMKNAITGAIFKTRVDNTHPLAFGYGTNYYTLKLGSGAYDYLSNGNAVYLENNARPISGFAGSEAKKKIGKSLVFGVENVGRGQVIYMVDNPLFRGKMENCFLPMPCLW